MEVQHKRGGSKMINNKDSSSSPPITPYNYGVYNISFVKNPPDSFMAEPGEIYGIPISRIKELIDLFMGRNYNLRDKGDWRRIKRDFFNILERDVKKTDLSQKKIKELTSKQLRKLPISSHSSHSSHSSTKSPCCRSLRGVSIFEELGIEVID